jgi:serine/threonine protein kinase
MSVMGEALASPEMRWKHGELLERADRIDDALVAYEAIEKKDAAYPGLAEKLAELRGRLGNTGTVAQSRPVVDPRAPTEAPAPEEDRYELIAEVGRGGMGVVYKARDRRLGRVVALKRLPENLRDHPTAVRLFLREARAAAALNHPNIVTLFDADQYDGNYYITMEFLEGLPLDAILRKRGKLALRDALRLSVQIATGLQYAHEAGVIHRDIKTSNLFFTKDKVVKIMDFGLAKMVEEVRRAATVIGGTPYYMAPEQSAGESVDHRADLYAFGVTLYELLTGRVPFTEGDVAYHHRHTPPPDPRELVPDLPEAPVALIERLMAKSADDRPARTAEVTAALQALLRG